MKKEEILNQIQQAALKGDTEQIQHLTSLLSSFETPVEPVKKKRGRPKKKTVVESYTQDEDDETEQNYKMTIEEVNDTTVTTKKKKVKPDKFVEQFKITTTNKKFDKTGKNVGWSKQRKIEFFDDKKEAVADIAIDKLLKVQENVPRDRDKVKKVRVNCAKCDQKFTTYSNNIHYYRDEETGVVEPVPMRCNACIGGK